MATSGNFNYGGDVLQQLVGKGRGIQGLLGKWLFHESVRDRSLNKPLVKAVRYVYEKIPLGTCLSLSLYLGKGHWVYLE